MRILVNEFVKVFNKKPIILIFIGLLILNGVLLYINDKDDLEKNNLYSSKEYNQIYKDIDGLTNQEALELLNDIYKKLENSFIFDFREDDMSFENDDSNNETDIEESSMEYESGDYLKYTDSKWVEMILYKDVIDEINACQTYNLYLDGIDNEAKIKSEVSIFSEPDSFSYRNIMKTPEVYSHLKGKELQFAPSRGIKMSTEFLGTDLIAILMLVVIVSSLLTREKELSRLPLIKTTYLGRRPLIISKLMVSFAGSFMVAVSLYGSNLLIGYLTYGFGDLGRNIQSVFGYIASNLDISVFQYLLFFIIAKIMIYCLITTVIFLVSTVLNDSAQVYIALVIIFALSGLAYYIIEPASYLSIFKYINLVSFINTYKFFNNYLNINVFGQPVYYIPLALFAIIISIVLLSLISINIFCKQKAISSKTSILSNRISPHLSKIPFFTHKTTSVFRHESYKVFIGGKVLIILLVFIGIGIYTYEPLSENLFDRDAYYYKDYMLQLEGKINKNKLEFIEEEDTKFQEIYDEMMSLPNNESSMYARSAYQEKLEPLNALEKVKEQTYYLRTTKNGEYLYDTGYKLLTGDESAGNKDIHLALIAFFMTIACLTYIYTIEYQSGAHVLLQSSYKGRRDTFVCKLVISIIIVTTIYLTTYLPYFYNVLNTYGRRRILAPANSMQHLSMIPSSISILLYLVIISLMRYVAMLISIIIIFKLSIRLKSYIATLLTSTGILVLPLLLSLLGISIFDYVLLNPLILGNVF